MISMIKKNFFFIVTLIMVGAGLSFILFSLHSSIKEKKENTETLEKRKVELKSLLQKSKIPPVRSSLTEVMAQLEESDGQYNHIKEMLSPELSQKPNLVPLEFKEELLKNQRLLMERAKLYKIRIPKSMGFVEYEGGIIPPKKDIAKLTEQLEMIRVLINFLIESRVESIDNIAKLSPVPGRADKGLYRVLPFQVDITCSAEALMHFLSKVYSSKTFFVIKNINIQKRSDKKLTIRVFIEAVVFIF